MKKITIFGNNTHKIIMGDVIEALQSISDNTVDLIFIDPPYNIGKNFNGYKDKWNNDQNYIKWCYRWLDLSIKKNEASPWQATGN